MTRLGTFLAAVAALVLVFSSFQRTEAKIGIKKLVKGALVLSALGSRKLPRFLPLPVPIPIR